MTETEERAAIRTLTTDALPDDPRSITSREIYRMLDEARKRNPKAWVALTWILWLGLPAVWAAAALALGSSLRSFVVLPGFIYGLTAMMVPWALVSSVGWRGALGLVKESRWMAATAAGSIGGGGLIALISWFAVF